MSANTIITNHHNLRKFEANANEMYSKQTTTKETQRRQHCRHNDSSSSSSNCNNNNIDYKNNENDWSRRRKGSSSNKSLKLRRNRKTTTTRTTTTTATSTEGAATTRTDDIAKQQHNHKRQDNRIDNLAVALLPTVTVTTTTTRNTSCCCNGSSSSSNFPAFPATPAPLPPPKWHRAAGLLSAYLLNSTLLVLAAKATATMVVGTTAAAVVDADINNNNNATRISNNDGNMSSSSSNSANCSLDFLSLGCISNSSLNASDDALSIDNASEYIFDRTYIRVIFITLYTMVFCCCFFGNLLVILVVTLSRRLRSITNFFLANLAVADFCVGTFCVMQNLSIYLIDSWVFGEFMCRMYQFVHSLSYTASIFILVVICTERYFAIVHPITCKQTLTAPRLRMAVVTVWIASALYSTPKFIFAKTIKNVHTLGGQEEYICVLDRKMFNSKVLDMINFGLLYLIPLLVMMVLYSKIAIALWRSSRGLSHHIASQSHQQENSIGMHNSMYHHHHAHAHAPSHLHGVAAVQNHTQQPPGTPLSGGSGGGGGLSRRQSSKYEKRGVSITESQHDNCKVSLDADRPIVTACRKTSFYHHAQPAAAPRVHVHNVSHSSNNVLRARRGVVRMLIIFVLTFALCNLPYHARKMWQYWSRSYRGDSNFNALLTPLTFLFSYFNSGVNPLIYAFLSRNFRKGMKELLLCSWKKGKGKSSTNSSMHHKRMALPTHSLPTDTTHIGNEQL